MEAMETKILKSYYKTQQINHNKYCYALIYKAFIRKSSIKICHFFASSDERLFRFLRKLNAKIRENRNIKTHQKHIELSQETEISLDFARSFSVVILSVSEISLFDFALFAVSFEILLVLKALQYDKLIWLAISKTLSLRVSVFGFLKAPSLCGGGWGWVSHSQATNKHSKNTLDKVFTKTT